MSKVLSRASARRRHRSRRRRPRGPRLPSAGARWRRRGLRRKPSVPRAPRPRAQPGRGCGRRRCEAPRQALGQRRRIGLADHVRAVALRRRAGDQGLRRPLDDGSSFGGVQLVISAYTLTYASLLITGGRLGDLFGRRRLFIVGLLLFSGASAVCGAAPSLGVPDETQFVARWEHFLRELGHRLSPEPQDPRA